MEPILVLAALLALPQPACAAARPRAMARKPAAAQRLLTLDSVLPFLDAPQEPASGAEPVAQAGDLRDAPAPRVVGLAPAFGWRGGPPVSGRPLESARPLLVRQPPAFKPRPLDAALCRRLGRELRRAIGAADAAGGEETGLPLRGLAEALGRQEAELAARQAPQDLDASLFSTDAETELHFALLKIEDRTLDAGMRKAEALAAARRAAGSLETAARRLSGR